MAKCFLGVGVKITGFMTDDAVLAELGARIARLRIDGGLTQRALAARAGVAKRTLERLENGDQVQLATLISVLRELGRLDAMDLVVPDVEIRPVQMLEGRVRQRASRRSGAAATGAAKGTWKWGDEK